MGDAKEDYPVFSVSKMKPRSWLFRVWNERTTWRTVSSLQVCYSNKRQWWSQRTKFEHEETKNAAKPKKNPPSLFDKQSAHTRTHTHTRSSTRAYIQTRGHIHNRHARINIHARTLRRTQGTHAQRRTYILDRMRGAMALDESKRIAVCSANHSRPVSLSNRRRIKTASV